MKTALLISLLLGQIGFLGAQDIEAIKIDPPFDLSEGTEVELSKDKLRPYKSWIESTKLQLTLMQEGNQTLTRKERYEKLRRGVEKVLASADQSRNELFTRYVLKRAIVIDNTLIEEEHNSRIIDVRLSLIEDSIIMALAKCKSDLVYLNLAPAQQGDLDFIGFGIEYSQFLSTLARTILDSGAQYKVYRSMLGFFQWDLYRDSNNKAEVANIYRINSALESISEQIPSDGLKTLQKIREMKHTYQTVISRIEQAISFAIAAKEIEARRLFEETQKKTLGEFEFSVLINDMTVNSYSILAVTGHENYLRQVSSAQVSRGNAICKFLGYGPMRASTITWVSGPGYKVLELTPDQKTLSMASSYKTYNRSYRADFSSLTCSAKEDSKISFMNLLKNNSGPVLVPYINEMGILAVTGNENYLAQGRSKSAARGDAACKYFGYNHAAFVGVEFVANSENLVNFVDGVATSDFYSTYNSHYHAKIHMLSCK